MPAGSALPALYWFIPSLFCLVLYWNGLLAWFQMDDFAWLSLHSRVHDFDSLMEALFQPKAQGTLRVISERLYFLGFFHLFGMEALPYRVLVFLTQFGNLILLTVVTRRLTGSALAGFLAPVLWLCSPVLYTPMSWTSAYNQILCSFVLLLEFYLLLRFVESGARRFYVAMWVVFLLGFGVLELNVVFPAIAAVYLFLFARRYLAFVAPMFPVSISYAIIHRTAGRRLQNVVYAMDWSPMSLLIVLREYVWMSVSPYSVVEEEPEKTVLLWLGTAVLVVLAGFAAWMIRRRRWLAIFLVAWFGICVAPYLPLSNHVSDYYLTVPVIGLAMLGSWGLAEAWRANTMARVAASAAVALFAIPGAQYEWKLTRYNRDKSGAVRNMVRGLQYAHKLHPNKMIVLKGVDSDLFWTGLYDRPQLALGWTELYITEEAERNIVAFSPIGSISDRFLPDAVTLEAIQSKQAVVYDVTGPRLRNITRVYAHMLASIPEAAVPRIIDAGNNIYDEYLREGWHDVDKAARWTSKRAVLEIRGPGGPGGKLTLRGWVTQGHTESGPLMVNVSVEGRSIGTRQITEAPDFRLEFDLPDGVAGKSSILVAVEVDRTVVAPPDIREIGLLFGTIEVTD